MARRGDRSHDQLDKKRRATAQPLPGSFVPVIDHARCEGKRDCFDVCPNDVFGVRPIDEADYRQLRALNRLKVRAHGMVTAYTPNADDCRACGLCVVACPEQAIMLTGIR